MAGRAEGNPFFVEELIATLTDRGVVGRQNGGWWFGQLPMGFSVPDTVQAVLAARIDLLPQAEKAALQLFAGPWRSAKCQEADSAGVGQVTDGYLTVGPS